MQSLIFKIKDQWPFNNIFLLSDFETKAKLEEELFALEWMAGTTNAQDGLVHAQEILGKGIRAGIKVWPANQPKIQASAFIILLLSRLCLFLFTIIIMRIYKHTYELPWSGFKF